MANYHYGLTFPTEEKRRKFAEKVSKEMDSRHISANALAHEIGYSRKSLYQFLNDPKIANKFLAAALADKLQIDP